MSVRKIKKELDDLGIKYEKVYPTGVVKLFNGKRMRYKLLIKLFNSVEEVPITSVEVAQTDDTTPTKQVKKEEVAKEEVAKDNKGFLKMLKDKFKNI